MNFSDYLNTFAATASDVYGTLQQAKAPKTTPTVTVTTTPAWQKYLPWGIGGLVLVVLVIVLAKK